ncbi:TPA: siphovirus Gp157 family protein [Yersinia enterocolitica]
MSTRTIDLAMEMKKLQELAENGEMTPEQIKDTLDGLGGMLEDKFDATMSFIRTLDGHADVCDKEAKRYADRKKSWIKQSNLLRKYLLECLITSKQDTLKTSLNTFTARKASVKLVVYDVDLLPDEMVNVQSVTDVISTPKMDLIKAEIEKAQAIAKVKALEEGKEVDEVFINPVPGTKFETGERSLAVR